MDRECLAEATARIFCRNKNEVIGKIEGTFPVPITGEEGNGAFEQGAVPADEKASGGT